MPQPQDNVDTATVESFGREWAKFDHAGASEAFVLRAFNAYFAVMDWSALPANATGFDMGCGSGRWARLVATRAGHLTCVDPSEMALQVARANLSDRSNCEFIVGTANQNSLADGSFDFGYSLGVLHHVPDTAGALRCCVRKLKPGGQFLLYLYYGLETRPVWFRILWKITDLLRRGISRLPFFLRSLICEVIAAVVYWPLACIAGLAERCGMRVDAFPLAIYREYPFYAMRTDALDRFGTKLERRFTKAEIEEMMLSAGLRNIRFSDKQPFWCAAGVRADC
ncbi:MAG: class I SAM-dependent methyltransferase [Terriglobales bacterium]